jgi:DNA-binding IclR family transcriptional regulator
MVEKFESPFLKEVTKIANKLQAMGVVETEKEKKLVEVLLRIAAKTISIGKRKTICEEANKMLNALAFLLECINLKRKGLSYEEIAKEIYGAKTKKSTVFRYLTLYFPEEVEMLKELIK